MNIIFLSDDPQEADLLKSELAKQSPAIQVEVCNNTQDASARIGAANPCEGILLDTSFPREDAVDLVASIRREKKPIGIVALADTADKNPPIDLFKAGVDNFILKRSGYMSLLGEALKQANERHKANAGPRSRKSRVLYAGDLQKIRPHLAAFPNLLIEPVSFAPDGLVKLSQGGPIQGTVLVIDAAEAGADPIAAVKDANLRMPEIPIILLTEQGSEEGAVQAMQAGAADCIVKSEDFIRRLIPAIEREIKYRDLALEKAALRAREERLRQIVESMPVGVTVIAPDGTFLAVNRAGLKLLGAARLDQIVGKNFVQLLPREEREKILGFLSNIARGVATSTRFDWKGLDGTIEGVELHAVPMRRDAAGTTAALAAIYPPGGTRVAAAEAEEAPGRHEALDRALKEAEVRFRELQEKSSFERSKFEELLKQLEERCAASEQQQAILKNAVQEAEARHQELLEKQQAERASWELTREGLKEQCAKIESMAESLRSTQADLLETHSRERAEWESKLRELENKRREAEEQLMKMSDALSCKDTGWEEARRELEEKAEEAEKARAAMESALQGAESRFAQLTEELDVVRSQHNVARLEFEQKIQEAENLRATLQASLQEADARVSQLSEELGTERSLRDSARLEFEQKIQEAENLRDSLQASLRDMESLFAMQTEEFDAERGQWNAIRSEFEQKLRLSEEQSNALRSALQHAETVLANKIEEHKSERAQWEAIQSELQENNKETENRRLALQVALDEVESYLSQQVENHNSERSQWNFARLELEQKCLHGEEQLAALQNALQEAERARACQVEDYETQLSEWRAHRLEWEQRLQTESEQKTALSEALQETESRCQRITEDYQDKCAQLDRALQQEELLQSEQKRILGELADLHLRYHALSQLSMAGVVMSTLDGQVLNCNDAAARMFGYAGVDAVRGQSGEFLFRIYSFENALKKRLLEDGKLENVEWSSLTRDGSLLRVQEYSKLILPASGEEPRVERILTDITRIHRLGEEIRRARRTESATDIAAATIKSFQELCLSFVSRGEILAESAGDESAVRTIADGLQNDAQRAIKHARQFFTAIQKADRIPETFDMNDVLTSNELLLRNLLGEDIDLQTRLSPRPSIVFANPQELVQLISGLMASSRESLPLGGSVLIETFNIEIEPSTPDAAAAVQAGIYVMLQITADGCTVYPERRIGSIQAIVDRMGGSLDTVSDTQAGNIYRLYFPRVEPLPSPSDSAN